MSDGLLLIVAVAAVGVLHTLVPDHWAPIALLARQRGWSAPAAARAAALAGVGHTVSTLAIAFVVWIAGALVAQRFGRAVSLLSDVALVAFGLWIALGSLRELRQAERAEHAHGSHAHADHAHAQADAAHAHAHRHAGGPIHRHWHAHAAGDRHLREADLAAPDEPPLHEHEHRASGRTALLLIAGSSPMVEGIPAFLAATRYGIAQLLTMALVFALATIATYVGLVYASTARLERVSLGPFERYGEVMSGAFIALVGFVFLFLG